MMRILLVIATLIAGCLAAPEQDKVFFPNSGYKGAWYSGYLNFAMGSFHYVFFESQRDPRNDPLVLWLNGGPGCSSLIGLFTENGPFVFQRNSSNQYLNPSAWNLKANMLYIESPGGVGFSTGKRYNKYDDGTVAQDNLNALLVFFTKFPEYKPNDFYVTGESYTGIYGPWLAYKIVQYNKLPSSKGTTINLKGIMIGNACTDPRQCYEPGDSMSIYQYQFLYKHGYIIDPDYLDLLGACKLSYGSKQCANIRMKIDSNFAKAKTSILNIYQPCYNPPQGMKPVSFRRRPSTTNNDKLTYDEMDCDDGWGMQQFLNMPNIQAYLHVNYANYFSCSDQVAQKYTMFSNASQWIYPILMKQGLRVWVYSGDVDADVPITGTINWLQRFKDQNKIPVIEQWRQWWVPGLHKHEDQVGGMLWRMKNITFVSVKGAGHMVPRDQPKAAYIMFNAFVTNTQLPRKSI